MNIDFSFAKEPLNTKFIGLINDLGLPLALALIVILVLGAF